MQNLMTSILRHCLNPLKVVYFVHILTYLIIFFSHFFMSINQRYLRLCSLTSIAGICASKITPRGGGVRGLTCGLCGGEIAKLKGMFVVLIFQI